MCTFCIHCGMCAGIAKPLVQPGVCPACKKDNSPLDDTCIYCGTPLPPAPAGIKLEPDLQPAAGLVDARAERMLT